MKAKIYSKEVWINETDPKILFDTFKTMLICSKFTIINSIDYYFTPCGYTALFLLAESHFAIHTFPEENKTYLQISSCNKQYYEIFLQNLQIYINSSKK